MVGHRQAEGSGLALILAFAAIGIGVIGWVLPSHDMTGLGVWKNFPKDTGYLDKNELFFNSSYRAFIPFPTGESGLSVDLIVNCLVPSKVAGANLQLQEATFSESTDANTTNFVNITSANVLIDNSNGFPCSPTALPGPLTSIPQTLPTPSGLSQSGMIFRVVGAGGGGPGDNPRFSSVSVSITETVANAVTWLVSFGGTAAFTATFNAVFPITTGVSYAFSWFATNSSFHEQGTATCTNTPGTNCVLTVNYPIAWSICCTPVSVVTTLNTVNGMAQLPNVSLPWSHLSLMKTQTVTV